MREEMRELGGARSAIRELFEYASARKAEIGEENVYDFSIGNPSAPPPAALTDTLKTLIETVPPAELHGYTSAAGRWETRLAVAKDLNARGIPADASHIFLTCGAAASLSIAFHALLNRGDEVIAISPYFPEYAVFLRQAGCKLVSVPADEKFRPDLSALARAVTPKTRGILINSPNNPTGAVYTRGELEGIAEICKAHKLLLFSDEPYRDLTYGAPALSPASLYPRTVLLYSYSKSLTLAGERIGYISLPCGAEDADEMFCAVSGAARALGYVCAPALFQRLIERVGELCADVSVYRKNRAALMAILDECGFSYAAPEGAFYFFVKAPHGDAAAFSARAKAHELLFVPSDSFGVKGYVRLSYCVPPESIARSRAAFRALAEESL